MDITYNLTLNERMAIHSHALSLHEYDRELLDMDSYYTDMLRYES